MSEKRMVRVEPVEVSQEHLEVLQEYARRWECSVEHMIQVAFHKGVSVIRSEMRLPNE